MTKGKYYIGLDPSYSAFGIAIIDTQTQTIILDERKADSHHDFVMMSWAVENLYNEILESYKVYMEDKNTYIGQEQPISAGINSGKLNALGCYFYLKLGGYSAFKRIDTYHPLKLKLFHNKKGYKKKDTIEVVTDILNYLESIGYKVVITKSRTKKTLSITDGEADAFMYAIREYMTYRTSAIPTKYIMEKYPRFSKIKSIEELNKYRG